MDNKIKKTTAAPIVVTPIGIDCFLRAPQVRVVTGWTDMTIWRHEKAGTFPKRRKLGKNTVGWLRSEVEEWVKTRQVAV